MTRLYYLSFATSGNGGHRPRKTKRVNDVYAPPSFQPVNLRTDQKYCSDEPVRHGIR